MTTANTVARVIAAEAVSGTPAQRLADMRAIASVIANRAQQLGVSQLDVVANQGQFNAYGARMPAGTAALVEMAQDAIDYVEQNGPTTNATFYATPSAVDGLPRGLNFETETAGHQFFSDPQFRAIDTAVGSIEPHQYAFAQNPENVPAPQLQSDFSTLTAERNVDPSTITSTDWGLNPNVAPVPVPTFNQWEAMANAQPVQAPVSQTPTTGLFSARAPVPTMNSFADVAAAGPFGGDFAAPADRFAGPAPSQSQPFEHYVKTTSIPTEVDPNSYQPGSAPMVDTSAAPTSRVQSISITPGQSFAPARAPQPITQADVDRALFNVTGDGQMDPSFVESLMAPGNPVVPSAVESATYAPGVDIAASRFATAAKTSRAMPSQTLADTARMDPLTGAIDPATNTASFMGMPEEAQVAANTLPKSGMFSARPANIDSFVEASRAQRGDLLGVNSAEMDAMEGHNAYALQKDLAARQAALMANNPALATPNFAQAVNPTVPSLASTPVGVSKYQLSEVAKAAQIPGVVAAMAQPAAVTEQATTAQHPALTPDQQAAGYQQLAESATNVGLSNLSGNNLYDINLSGERVPVAPYTPTNTLEEPAPDLETITVPDQPALSKTQTEIPGPATTEIEPAQKTTAQKTATASTTAQPSRRGFWDSLISPQTAIGAAIGTIATGNPIGGFFGALAGQQVAQNPGMFSNEPMQINDIGSGYDAVTSIWGGGQPVGTQATASDGQTVTAMPGGSTAITNKFGVTTVFDSTGKAMSYFGNDLDQGQGQNAQTATTNGGGFFGGLFG